LGLDSDNGSEFINYEMLHYCQREKITFTRSRSYRKNDQAHVEEKNGSIVRRLIGYDRYEGVEAWQALHELYVILRQYVNFFQPSMKLLQKKRNQGHVSKRYDSAQTPYQRLLSSKSLKQDQKRQLEQHYETLDPVALMREVEHRQDRFWSHAHGGTSTDSTPQPSKTSPESMRDIAVTPSPLPKISDGPRFYRRTSRPSASRHWRTRKDPFEQVWPQVRIQLQLNPEQTAKKIIGEILERTTGEPLHNYKVRDWLDHWLEMKERVRAGKTMDRYRQVIRDFSASLGSRANLALSHITPKDVLAYRNSITYNGESAERHADLGEALLGAAGGVVTAEAKTEFDRAVALNADDPKGNYFLGIAAEQDGRNADAAKAWRGMLAGAPADAPWAEFIRGEVARVAGGPGGPSEQDVAAASDLDAEQRTAMIRGMVERLAERLDRDGSDLDGWLRLVRSYMVLGDQDKARAAAGSARRALAREPDKLRQIEELVKGLGLEG
jgi:hypothetical protein